MRGEYVAPDAKKQAFNCPFCHAYSMQLWQQTVQGQSPGPAGTAHRTFGDLTLALCSHCMRYSIWIKLNGADLPTMVYPTILTAPPPSDDMPSDIKVDYNEARSIYEASPRASAALLRLCIQKLCRHLGQPGKNINEDIGELVKTGLPARIQQSLDAVRVVGNNAVHPGTMDLKDRREIALSLFKQVNIIVDVMITQPKETDALFAELPQSALDAIAKRDSNVT